MFTSELLSDSFPDLSDLPNSNSWDFLKDLDPGIQYKPVITADRAGHTYSISTNTRVSDPGAEAPPLSAKAMQNLTASERKQEKNRLAQKRFRMRKKERSSTTEAQLAETTTQLQALKFRQKQLEARNTLLEQLTKLNTQNSLQEGPYLTQDNQYFWQDEAKVALINMTETTMEGSAIVVTIYGHKQLMTMDEFATMSIVEFAKLFTAYTRKQAQNLVELADNPDGPALASLQRWSLESTALFVCLCIANPRKHNTVKASRMDDGTLCEPHPDKLYDELLVAVAFTPSQVQDLLHLRCLFYQRLGQLSRQRQHLLHKMPEAGVTSQMTQSQPVKLGFCHTSDALGGVTAVADQLRMNGADESRAYMHFSAVFYRGIHTSKQHAVSMVHFYPLLPHASKEMEALARQHMAPSIEALMEPGEADDLQHAANWQQVEQYVQTYNLSNLHNHLPFLKDDVEHAG